MTLQAAFRNLPAARALRALQKIDEASQLAPEAREWLLEAEDALGEELGLTCETPRDHNGGTCPIHEWLDEGDAEIVHELERQGRLVRS